jgi:transposase
MDSHTDSVQVRRLDVVQTGRRRRWSDDEKLRIVLESLQGPRQASSTARRHGISPSLLFTWRRAFGAERVGASGPLPGFVPAVIIPEERKASAGAPARGRMVIVLASGRQLIVDAEVDATALARVLDVLERR